MKSESVFLFQRFSSGPDKGEEGEVFGNQPHIIAGWNPAVQPGPLSLVVRNLTGQTLVPALPFTPPHTPLTPSRKSLPFSCSYGQSK